MAQDKKPPAVPERATQAATKPTRVPLSDFILIPEQFCHRDDRELKDEDRLRSLMDSLAAEGLQTPVEFYRDGNGRPVIVKGHRRISALRRLAQQGKPGFTADMPVEAIEVTGASRQDLVVRSVIDNRNRQDLSQAELIRAAKTLADSGVTPERAASALGVSTKTYARLLLIAGQPWMFDLVNRNAVPISYAPTLLEVATKEKRLAELEEDLKKWVAAKEKEIGEKAKAKKLSAAKQLVRAYLSKPLVDHWVAQLRKKEKLDAVVPKGHEVGIDPDAHKVSLKVPEIDLMKTPLPKLARLVGEIETAKEVMVQYLKTRHALEAAKGPQDVAREALERPGGLDFLRSEGLSDLADEVELGLMEEAEHAEDLPDEGSDAATEGA
jgi:ParB-like chromosome segregation protein Spo0J